MQPQITYICSAMPAASSAGLTQYLDRTSSRLPLNPWVLFWWGKVWLQSPAHIEKKIVNACQKRSLWGGSWRAVSPWLSGNSGELHSLTKRMRERNPDSLTTGRGRFLLYELAYRIWRPLWHLICKYFEHRYVTLRLWEQQFTGVVPENQGEADARKPGKKCSSLELILLVVLSVPC